MRKADIHVGVEYAAQRGKYGSPFKVRVDRNEEMHAVTVYSKDRRIPRDVLDKDPAFVAAHLADALCEAYPEDSTSNEAKAAGRAVAEARSAAVDAWYGADPMRAFKPGRGLSGSYGTSSGIPCQVYPTYGYERVSRLDLVERRHIVSTWDEHVQAQNLAKQRAAEREVTQAEAKVLREQQRAELMPLLEAALGKNAPYVSNYDRKVTLSFEQALELLKA